MVLRKVVVVKGRQGIFGLLLMAIALLTGCFATNSPPAATFTAFPTSGEAPLRVSFNASGSSDSDGSIISYIWSFGDGKTGSGMITAHTYAVAGTYTATLTVTDDDNATGSFSNIIQVTEPSCQHCIRIVTWQFGIDARGAPAVTGTAQDDCPYPISYVELFAHFYDADGIEIGTYWDITAGVLPGEEWNFEIECPISAVWPSVDHASVEVHACEKGSLEGHLKASHIP